MVRSLLMQGHSRGPGGPCQRWPERPGESFYRFFVFVGVYSCSLGRVMRTMRRFLGEPGLGCSGSSSASGAVATVMHEGALDAAGLRTRGLDRPCGSAFSCCGSSVRCCGSELRWRYVSAPTVRTYSLCSLVNLRNTPCTFFGRTGHSVKLAA